MAQEKTKKVSSPCEQYVVAKLESVEKELAALKKDYELLKKVHQDLVEIVRLGTENFTVKTEIGAYSGETNISIYLGKDYWTSYIDSERVSQLNENPRFLNLLNLIKKGQSKVERES